MSQSPTQEISDSTSQGESLDRYLAGWNSLNDLLRKGGSLSGREQNCCYLNLGPNVARRFADVSQISGFDAPVDGRGMAVTDWDHDGDLDVWMSNRTGPRVQFMRNDGKSPRHFVSLRLQGTKSNRDAVGARVEIEVEPSLGTLSRTVIAGEGYLSQSSKWLHFGLGDAERIAEVRVRWPGSQQFITIDGVTMDGGFLIVEGQPSAERKRWSQSPTSHTPKSRIEVAALPNRVIFTGRIPMPRMDLHAAEQAPVALPVGRPSILLFWSPDCPLCAEELTHWSEQAQQVRQAGLEIIAVSAAEDATAIAATNEAIARLGFQPPWGVVQPSKLELIEAYLGFLQIDYQRPLLVPMSLLVDEYGNLAAVYREKVTVDDVLRDLKMINQPPDELRQSSLPFVGKWLRSCARLDPIDFASRLDERFGSSATIPYFEHLVSLADLQIEQSVNSPYAITPDWRAEVLIALSTTLLAEGRYQEAGKYGAQAHELLPTDFRPLSNVGVVLMKLNRPQEALGAFNRALELQPNRPSVLVNRASVYVQLRRLPEALRDWETLIEQDPADERSRLAAATISFALGDDRRSAMHYEEHLSRNPDSVDAAGALAWLLATSQDADVRNGARAVELATRWSNQLSGEDYKALNALAAALAEKGDFAEAVATIDRAIGLAQAQKDAQATAAYQQRRQLYREGRPFRRGSL